jgi:hypothetical protein
LIEAQAGTAITKSSFFFLHHHTSST